MKEDQINLKLLKLLDESTEIICTNGTISNVKLEEILSPYEGIPIYAFLDADKSGEQIRSIVEKNILKQFIYIPIRCICEVATTPFKVLASILKSVNIKVKRQYLL